MLSAFVMFDFRLYARSWQVRLERSRTGSYGYQMFVQSSSWTGTSGDYSLSWTRARRSSSIMKPTL